MIRMTESNLYRVRMALYLGVSMGIGSGVFASACLRERNLYIAALCGAIASFVTVAGALCFLIWSNAASKRYSRDFGRRLPLTAEEFLIVQPNVRYHLKAQAEKCQGALQAKETFLGEMSSLALATDEETDANLKTLAGHNERIADEDEAFFRKRASAKNVGFLVPKDQLAAATLR